MDSTDWDERYRTDDLVWGAEPNRFVRDQCQHLPVGEAVDLGCGEGRNALWLAKLGWHVTGIDYSPVAIARAQELTRAQPHEIAIHVRWRVDDVTVHAVRRSSVDLALVSYLHLPRNQHDTVIQMAARALRTDGHLVVVGHDRRNLTEGVSGPQDPDLLYEPAELRTLLESLPGLSVDLAGTVERPTAAGVALDTLVRVRRTA